VKLAGVDLAAQPSNTALCVLDGRDIAQLSTSATDDMIIEGLRGCAKVGIDAPFGWPRPFVEAVVAHRDGEPWPGRDAEPDSYRRSLRLRRTDEAVCELGMGITPLSVSTDRIGVAAFRCALLLDRLGGVDRSGATGKVCEVYPAAALRRWFGDDARGYRSDEGRRDELLRRIARASRLRVGSHRKTLVANDHAFDALVSALTALAVKRRATALPVDRALAREEGWIHVPPAGARPLELG
jgi:predicted nuclease with RNAse H fold